VRRSHSAKLFCLLFKKNFLIACRGTVENTGRSGQKKVCSDATNIRGLWGMATSMLRNRQARKKGEIKHGFITLRARKKSSQGNADENGSEDKKRK